MNRADAEEYTEALGQVVAGSWRQILLAERLGVPEALELTTREWVEQRLGGYIRLSIPERREAVAELIEAGMEQRDIADVVGVHEATISRDVDELADASENAGRADDAVVQLADASEPPMSPGAPDPHELGVWRTVVLDPPWRMEKIEREERPNQGQWLDYPTMDVDEIAQLPIPQLVDPDGAHVYVWTTHRYLPRALDLLSEWGCRYECQLTWRKNVGITPYSWMYDTEHVLFARAGAGLALNRNGLRLSFSAPVTGHSRKPDVFYERVRAVSPEPRLEMFARDPREGFVPWGDEVAA